MGKNVCFCLLRSKNNVGSTIYMTWAGGIQGGPVTAPLPQVEALLVTIKVDNDLMSVLFLNMSFKERPEGISSDLAKTWIPAGFT